MKKKQLGESELSSQVKNTEIPNLSDLEEISPLDLKDRRGEILRQVEAGRRFVVSRRGRKLAMIVPVSEASLPDGVTPQLLKKLQFIDGLSEEEIETLIKIVREEISLVDLIKR